MSLSSTEEQSSLQARWSSPAGERDFYLVTLQEGEERAPARNISVDGGSTHVTFHGLSPGEQYSVQVTAVAGPYRASAGSTAAWTRKQKAQTAPLGTTLLPRGRAMGWGGGLWQGQRWGCVVAHGLKSRL